MTAPAPPGSTPTRATARSTPPRSTPSPAQDWRRVLVVFWITQLVESLGVSQVYALLPAYLRELGVPEADRLAFVGVYGSLVFVLGLPLVPLWGGWAEKYSREGFFVPSALVEVAAFGAAPLPRAPRDLAHAVVGAGLQ